MRHELFVHVQNCSTNITTTKNLLRLYYDPTKTLPRWSRSHHDLKFLSIRGTIVAKCGGGITTMPLRRYQDHQDLTTTVPRLYCDLTTTFHLESATNFLCMFKIAPRTSQQPITYYDRTTTPPRPYHDGSDCTTILNFRLFV